MFAVMEQLLSEIEEYAAARGLKPATVVQYATGQGGGSWHRWKDGYNCTLGTAQKIREFMRDNPPSQQPHSEGS